MESGSIGALLPLIFPSFQTMVTSGGPDGIATTIVTAPGEVWMVAWKLSERVW